MTINVKYELRVSTVMLLKYQNPVCLSVCLFVCLFNEIDLQCMPLRSVQGVLVFRNIP